jgi:hypothetical protein
MTGSTGQTPAQIHEIAAKNRRFATETSDPWVSKNHFDGGAIQYVMLANETSPLTTAAVQSGSFFRVFDLGNDAPEDCRDWRVG